MRLFAVPAMTAMAIGVFAGGAQAGPLVLSYSGTLYDDGVRGAAYFDNTPTPTTVAFSFQAEFDPATGFALGKRQEGFVASNVTFSIAGYGNFNALAGSYFVTLQDPTGGGLFGDFVHTYAAGLDETIEPGAGAFLTGFTTANPGFTALAPKATIFGGDLGAIAEMYTKFTSGDELDFYIPDPIPGTATASISVPEPAALAIVGVGMLGLQFFRRRRNSRGVGVGAELRVRFEASP
jgi:hypothetical protein